MSTHLQTPPITCGIMSWDDSISQAGNTNQIPSRVHIEQGRPSPKQVIQTYFPNPRQEAPCQLPNTTLVPQHPTPSRASSSPRACSASTQSGEEVSDAPSQRPVAAGGKMLDAPTPHTVPQSSQTDSTLEHAESQLPPDPVSWPPSLAELLEPPPK